MRETGAQLLAIIWPHLQPTKQALCLEILLQLLSSEAWEVTSAIILHLQFCLEGASFFMQARQGGLLAYKYILATQNGSEGFLFPVERAFLSFVER